MNKTAFAVVLVAVVLALGAIDMLVASNSSTYSLSCRSQTTLIYEGMLVNWSDLSVISTFYTTQLGGISTYATTINSSASAGVVISTTITNTTASSPNTVYTGITCTYTK
jgi:hypothetical protein